MIKQCEKGRGRRAGAFLDLAMDNIQRIELVIGLSVNIRNLSKGAEAELSVC